MRLSSDWRRVLRRAWSIRLIVVAGLLSGAEVALPLIGEAAAIPPGAFAAASGLVTAAAFVARLLAQQEQED
ncbi:hypothetical protein [Oricola thermophila]|uniref:Uncharacterized protein n=1 Tax=Oricola thermophila TaxID=2742145 RepID=A0A6N1VHG1_9HYPH|nr:hypothetical protein [Oricola thermophila]QKV20228.1 hypothetical protein HTY61_18115 [Oricola thermophila]